MCVIELNLRNATNNHILSCLQSAFLIVVQIRLTLEGRLSLIPTLPLSTYLTLSLLYRQVSAVPQLRGNFDESVC